MGFVFRCLIKFHEVISASFIVKVQILHLTNLLVIMLFLLQLTVIYGHTVYTLHVTQDNEGGNNV